MHVLHTRLLESKQSAPDLFLRAILSEILYSWLDPCPTPSACKLPFSIKKSRSEVHRKGVFGKEDCLGRGGQGEQRKEGRAQKGEALLFKSRDIVRAAISKKSNVMISHSPSKMVKIGKYMLIQEMLKKAISVQRTIFHRQKPERGYIRMFPQNENQNEGTPMSHMPISFLTVAKAALASREIPCQLMKFHDGGGSPCP